MHDEESTWQDDFWARVQVADAQTEFDADGKRVIKEETDADFAKRNRKSR